MTRVAIRSFPAWWIALALVLLLPSSGAAGGERHSTSRVALDQREYVPGEVLVRFRPGVDAGDRTRVLRATGSSVKEVLPLAGLRLVQVAAGTTVEQAVDALERRPEVLYAEPNHLYRLDADNYTDNTDSALTMAAPASLAGRVGCAVGYEMLLETEFGFDFFHLEWATSAAGPWVPVNAHTGSTFGTFVPMTEDLTAADGRSDVFLRLRLTSDESFTDDGVYIEDLTFKCEGSTLGPTSFETLSGTSMATPHVTGVAALKWAQTPAATVANVKSAILDGVDQKGSLLGSVATGGRLNACKALVAACPTPTPLTPNDARFAELWGLHQPSDADIDAPEAWGTETGDAGVVVAVVDSGVAYSHPELDGNIWVNPDEIAGNSVDDDGNGFVDDVRGWDFVSEDNDPRDFLGHGTHVAGTIGAEGNNGAGVPGVNWDVSLMALQAGDSFGLATEDIVASFLYACREGAKVVNGSFGGFFPSPSIRAAVQDPACQNTLFVFAAGNDGFNNDDSPSTRAASGRRRRRPIFRTSSASPRRTEPTSWPTSPTSASPRSTWLHQASTRSARSRSIPRSASTTSRRTSPGGGLPASCPGTRSGDGPRRQACQAPSASPTRPRSRSRRRSRRRPIPRLRVTRRSRARRIPPACRRTTA